MYTLGNWPLPSNGYAEKVFRNVDTWNKAVTRALENAPRSLKLTQILLEYIDKYGYDHKEVSRLVMQYQPKLSLRYCTWCGEAIALATNVAWCGEHEHLSSAYWHKMEMIRKEV